jgi:hypothetical protein
MYKPIHFLIRNRKFSTGKFFIRNKDLPVCSNCLHFIEYTNKNPFDGNRCKKFGEMDVITGAIKYDLAAVCRLKDDACGETGNEYTAKIQTHSPSTFGNSGSGSVQS